MPGTVLPLCAALAAGTAVLLWLPPRGWVVALRLGGPATAGPAGPAAGGAADLLRRLRPRRTGPGRWVPAVAAVCAAPWLVTSPVTALLLATLGGVSVQGWGLAARARAGRAAAALSAEVAVGVELLAAELRTGVVPAAALRSAADDLPLLAPAAEVSRRGGDVPAALDAAAAAPGAADLVHLAAAWRVAERSGAPVAQVLDHVVEALRADQDLAREVRAECAAARATARVLAILPLLGLGLGSGLGGDPVHVLTATLPGVVCLAAGSALALAGLAWVDRITGRAERAR